ncbi:hypothetical protein EDC01DRAFT_624248 [Geopyxis carbonaria]|nr:hypothetical protein EDC01DRAFT_624248 [Geopyxis carbonaria]
MENLSATAARMLPGLGGGDVPTASGFDMGAIPGFDVIQKLFLNFGLDPSFLGKFTLGMSLTLVTSLLSFFTYSFGSLTTMTRFISANLVSSATIHSSDVTYLYIMRWLATHRISTDCRLFCVTSRKNPQSYAVRRYSSYAPYGDGNRSCQEDDEDGDAEGEDDVASEDDSLGPKLKYTPAPGFLYFWHKGRPIIINRKLDLSYYTGDIPDETIVLTTIGRSPTFLREILSEARRDYLQAQSRKTMVYTLSPTPFAQKTWDQGRHRPSRDISTVIMPQDAKEHLLCDVKEYLNPVTMRWYAQRGLPYRRGYLFYGPPGTGKTSLSLALAGELKLPLYILSLSTGSLTDETLTMLFVGLPRKCIVLLEDIDCAGPATTTSTTSSSSSAATSSKDKKPSSSGHKDTPGPRRPRISVSFSGLLNAIDGVASHEGRILIMTTNHRERLDSALIRPGRVDVQIEFGPASTATLAEIFRELYKELGSASDAPAEKRLPIAALADTFAARIPPARFTPAEIQGFLMSYKGQPERALAHIDAWVAAKLRARGRTAKAKPGKAKKSKSKSKLAKIGEGPPRMERWDTGSSAATTVAPTPPETPGAADLMSQFLGMMQRAVEKSEGLKEEEPAKVNGVNGVAKVNGVHTDGDAEKVNGVCVDIEEVGSDGEVGGHSCGS